MLLKLSALALAAGICCLQPQHAFWQSRDSNYNRAAGAVGGGGTGNPVTFNSKAVQNTPVASGTSLSISGANGITVGTGTNRALVFVMGMGGTGLPTINVTWDVGGTSQAMTPILSFMNSSNNCSAMIFGLLNPTPGNNVLTASWTGNREANGTALDFTHVNQSNMSTAFPHTATGDETTANNPAAVAVNSATNNYTVAMFTTSWLWSTGTATQVELFLDNGLSLSAYEAQRAAGSAGSISFAVTASAAGHPWAAAAIDIAHD
jgi:hypothetical protein